MEYIVYFRPSCPYSRKAIDLLQRAARSHPDITLKIISVNSKTLVDILEKANIFHHRTVPAIFENGHFIGGYDQLVTALKWLDPCLY